MQLLSIGIPNALSNGSDSLKHGIRDLNIEGINVAVNLNDCGHVTFFNLNVEDKASCKNINKIKNYIAEIISDIIVNQIDKKLIKKIIGKYYYYFNQEEKLEIAKIANGILDNEVNRETFKLIKKEQIYTALKDFLSDNERIDIEGFVNFRLRDFIGELSEVVDRAVDEYMMQKEYNEFIGLLKYFVELQDSKINILNILVNEDGKFGFYDSNNKPITGEFLSDISIEFSGGELSDDDMLISTLITVAPAKIYIHSANNIKNKEILETMKKVFSGRVFICHGCELCLAHEIRK